MDYSSAYAIGAVVGSLVMGIVLGLVPLITGIKKQKVGLGVGGFFACLVGAFVLGILLGAPLCGLFMFLILRKPKDAQNDQSVQFPQGSNDQQAM
ncbi:MULTISPECIES: hypothetical protein [unclassified Butyrivibrio]|uniref:hypothetical protein n=1 Tax=unclassified Butyrivibrio TaxID=2639466 RepID=UPI0003B3D776|nr:MULTISPECIES: hypothetical protein [unclassified Butyrivibrio]MDC7293267.1 hypothetical protein [Butyrivibrio sp. DSM 10294]